MNIVVPLLIFVAVLFTVVTVHEVGHFLAARSVGVPIAELGLGFPPRLFAFKRKGTEYSINAIPLGAFVRPEGDTGVASSNSLSTRSPWVRIWVSLAGPLANVVLAFLLFSGNFILPVQVTVGGEGGAEIMRVLDGSPAALGGIEVGDAFLRIDGEAMQTSAQMNQTIGAAALDGRSIAIVVVRDQVERTVTLMPRANPPEGEGAIGIAYRWLPPYVTQSYRSSVTEAGYLGGRMLAGIPSVLRDSFFSGDTTLVGPVGAGQMTVEVVGRNVRSAILLAGFISIGIGVFNLLPVPPLDGGGIAIALVEAARRGKRLSARGTKYTYTVGTALLIALFVTITFNDILRLIRGDTILP